MRFVINCVNVQNKNCISVHLTGNAAIVVLRAYKLANKHKFTEQSPTLKTMVA
jgi:hypothetical protein